MERVAVASAAAWTTSWNGSNSFLAAITWMESPVPVGGAASRRTLSMVVVVQRVAVLGDGRAKVSAPVGVQSVQVWPSLPPVPPAPLPPGPELPPWQAPATARERATRETRWRIPGSYRASFAQNS